MYREGYYWVLYKDFTIPHIIYLVHKSWDNTRDGDRWVIEEDGDEIPEKDFYKYRFLQYIPEPQWPYEDVEIKIDDQK